MCKIYSAIVLLLFSFCIYACYNIRRKLSVQYFLFIFGITLKPKQLVCGILCNRDNCKRGPRSRVGLPHARSGPGVLYGLSHMIAHFVISY